MNQRVKQHAQIIRGTSLPNTHTLTFVYVQLMFLFTYVCTETNEVILTKYVYNFRKETNEVS